MAKYPRMDGAKQDTRVKLGACDLSHAEMNPLRRQVQNPTLPEKGGVVWEGRGQKRSGVPEEHSPLLAPDEYSMAHGGDIHLSVAVAISRAHPDR